MDRRDQILACFHLQHEAPNSRTQRIPHQLRVAVYRKQHDRLAKTALQKNRTGGNATDIWHLEVRDHHIRFQIPGKMDEGRAVTSGANNLKFRSQKRSNLLQEILVIVGDH